MCDCLALGCNSLIGGFEFKPSTRGFFIGESFEVRCISQYSADVECLAFALWLSVEWILFGSLVEVSRIVEISILDVVRVPIVDVRTDVTL